MIIVKLSKSQPRKSPPAGTVIYTFAVYTAKNSDKVAADYFCEVEGAGYPDTTISLALPSELSEERKEALRQELENALNALVEEKYSYFVEIVGEAVHSLHSYWEIVGHSSYVPS